MSELVKVYDLEGEAFELTVANANDAEAHLGWTRNPPAKPVKVEAPVADEPVKDEAPVVEDVSSRGRPKKL